MKPVLILAIFFSGAALAAPDEALLGKAEGYPYCAPTTSTGAVPERCLVALYSHYDADIPAHKVAGAPVPSVLERSPAEPPIAYRHRGQARSIDAFLDSNRNTGLLVLSGNRILVERYQYGRKPEDRFQAMSMTKTVLAMLIGIALKDRQISSIDDLAQKYVPGLKGHPYGETSLRHLLTMSSGVRFVERYDGTDDGHLLVTHTLMQEGPGGADTVAPFRGNPREHPAGSHFAYASAESQVLGLVLHAAVGRPLAEYLSEKIWRPMGAEADATWLVDRGGYETGYMGINATLRDWGRFGLLLANDGALNGRQIIPAAWVRAATTAEAPHLAVGAASPYNGYGYQTWLVSAKARQFAAFGLRGQAIFVDPATKLVVVHTAVYPPGGDARAEQFSLFFGTINFLKSLMTFLAKPKLHHPTLPKNKLGFTRRDYEGKVSTLCAGCGHDSISAALIQAFWELDIQPHRVAKLSGIGCSSKTPDYFLGQSHGFNTVHGRMPSVLTGANLANRDLIYLGVSGDGDSASIGLGQFAHVMRRGVNMTYILENNGVYGLTKGQFSATADKGSKAKKGAINADAAIDTVSLALLMGATFVARSFSGDKTQLVPLVKTAIAHQGAAFIDVISPCVAFNNHPGSTKSYDYVREHNEAVNRLDFWPSREAITVSYEPNETISVPQHDGSIIKLRKLHEDYDPSDKINAAAMIASAAHKGEVLTGLLYLAPDAEDLHAHLETYPKAFNSLGEKELCPGSAMLEKINAGLR